MLCALACLIIEGVGEQRQAGAVAAAQLRGGERRGRQRRGGPAARVAGTPGGG